MAKKVAKMVKLQVEAAKATPAPPVGPALGQAGVNIMAFVKEFNERTAKQAGLIIPVEITVFEDRSFTFITKPSENLMVPVNQVIYWKKEIKFILENIFVNIHIYNKFIHRKTSQNNSI